MKVLKESWNAHMKRVLKAKAGTLTERIACFLLGHKYRIGPRLCTVCGLKRERCTLCGKDKPECR